MDMKRKCIGCGKYFDKYNRDRVFICEKCQVSYVADEQKKISNEIKNELKSEIKETLREKFELGDDSYYLRYRGNNLEIDMSYYDDDELKVTIRMTDKMSRNYNTKWCADFDLCNPNYMTNIIEHVCGMFEDYDKDMESLCRLEEQLSILDESHRTIKWKIIKDMADRWRFKLE